MAKSKKLDKMLKKASDAVERRNYDLAIFQYTQVLTIDPTHLDARIALRACQGRAAKENGTKSFKAATSLIKANALKVIKNYEGAILSAEIGLAANPESTGLMKIISDCAVEAEMLDLAAWQRQEIADKHDPEDLDNLWALADIYKDLSKAQEAIAICEQISRIDPDEDTGPFVRNLSAELTSDIFARGVTEGSRAIIADSDEAEKLELDSGKLRTDEQRLKAINHRLKDELVKRPDDHRAWLTIGEIAYDLDDWTEGYARSKEYLNKAREINPTDNSIVDKLGDVEMKNLKLQLLPLQKNYKANPQDADAKAKLMQLRKKDLKYRQNEYERRVKAQPLKAVFHFHLGNIYMQTKRFDDAIAELQKSAKDPKYRINALTSLGRCFQNNGQIDMAISQYKRAREGQELFAKIREPLYFEAIALEEKGDKESLQQALGYYTQIYEQDISFREIKTKVPELQKKLAAL